jgi:hypothetical protein
VSDPVCWAYERVELLETTYPFNDPEELVLWSRIPKRGHTRGEAVLYGGPFPTGQEGPPLYVCARCGVVYTEVDGE